MKKTEIIALLGYKGIEAKKAMLRTKNDLETELMMVNNIVDYTVDNITTNNNTTVEEETTMKNTVDGFMLIAQAQKEAEAAQVTENAKKAFMYGLTLKLAEKKAVDWHRNKSVIFHSDRYHADICKADVLCKYIGINFIPSWNKIMPKEYQVQNTPDFVSNIVIEMARSGYIAFGQVNIMRKKEVEEHCESMDRLLDKCKVVAYNALKQSVKDEKVVRQAITDKTFRFSIIYKGGCDKQKYTAWLSKVLNLNK